MDVERIKTLMFSALAALVKPVLPDVKDQKLVHILPVCSKDCPSLVDGKCTFVGSDVKPDDLCVGWAAMASLTLGAILKKDDSPWVRSCVTELVAVSGNDRLYDIAASSVAHAKGVPLDLSVDANGDGGEEIAQIRDALAAAKEALRVAKLASGVPEDSSEDSSQGGSSEDMSRPRVFGRHRHASQKEADEAIKEDMAAFMRSLMPDGPKGETMFPIVEMDEQGAVRSLNGMLVPTPPHVDATTQIASQESSDGDDQGWDA